MTIFYIVPILLVTTAICVGCENTSPPYNPYATTPSASTSPPAPSSLPNPYARNLSESFQSPEETNATRLKELEDRMHTLERDQQFYNLSNYRDPYWKQ